MPNIFPILPGLRNLPQSVLPLPDGTPRTGPVEPPAPPTDALGRIDLPYYRPPIRPWYPPVSSGTGGSPNGQQVPPFGPPPVYVMPPVWTGTPYRPPYYGVPLPPIPPDLWGREPWWLRGQFFGGEPLGYMGIEPPVPPRKPWYEALPFRPGDPRPDMGYIQPVPGSAPPPQPEPVKTTPPKKPTWRWDPFEGKPVWDYQREGIQRD